MSRTDAMPEPPAGPRRATPTARPGTLPDGRGATLCGGPHRWDGGGIPGSPSSACLALLGGVAATPAPLSARGLRDALRAVGRSAFVEHGDSLEDLAQLVELGRLVIAVLNAGLAWDVPASAGFGEPNHAVLVPCVARNPQSGDLVGAYVVDPVHPQVQFLAADKLVRAWLEPGGLMISADQN